MTEEQFNLIVKLIRSTGPSRQAAKLILIDNMRPADAARQCSCSPQAAGQSAKNIDAAYQDIRRVFNVT